MRYVLARIEEDSREEAYRIYVCKSLQLIPQNKCLTKDYLDILAPQEVDPRSGDDIALDVIANAGLNFGG